MPSAESAAYLPRRWTEHRPTRDPSFSVNLSATQNNVYYTAYVSESLSGPFVAEAIAVGTGGDLLLAVKTSDRPTLFMIVTATETAPALGAELE